MHRRRSSQYCRSFRNFSVRRQNHQRHRAGRGKSFSGCVSQPVRSSLVGSLSILTATSQFDDDDRPMPGVRLYLSNGQSVITDSEGMYNFPSLGDGPQVISLDPVSVPPGYALTDGGRESGKGWTRLLRTPMGGGALLRQNFALLKSVPSASADGSQEHSVSPRRRRLHPRSQHHLPRKMNRPLSVKRPT